MSQPADRAARVVFLDRDTLSPETVAARAGLSARARWSIDRTTAEQVAGRIADADIVITNKAPVREAALAGRRAAAAGGGGGDRHRRGRRQGLQRARRHRLQHPQLRGQHRARAHLRAAPGAAAQHPALPQLGGARPVARGGAVLLFRLPDPRPRRLDAGHDRRRRARQVGGQARRGVRHEGAVLRLQGHHRHGAALHAVLGRAAPVRRDHPAHAAAALDPQPDRPGRVRGDGRASRC